MDTTPRFPTLRVVSHPLVQHKLTILRDRSTPTKIFKELVEEIAMLMAYEATSQIELEDVRVETPLESTLGHQLSGKKLTLVPILRAGLGMVEGIYRLVPNARIGHIGLYRNHDTLQPVDYYFKVPGDAPERDFFVLDPMLATGGSAVAAVSPLTGAGARSTRLMIGFDDPDYPGRDAARLAEIIRERAARECEARGRPASGRPQHRHRVVTRLE